MKTTLLLAFFGLLSGLTFGQVTTTIDGNVHTPAVTYSYASDTNTIVMDALVNNTSGAPLSLTIKRVILNPVASWTDDICWGSSSFPLEGQCYFGIQATDPFTTPDVQTINDGDNGILQIKINPKDPDYGCGEYRYYVLKNGTEIVDSISITVCKTVSVEELAPALSITMAPNPANTYVKVKTNDIEGATIKVVDVLGNVVLKETVMGTSKTINTQNFRNGVYFVRVEADNQRTINRKLIVKH